MPVEPPREPPRVVEPRVKEQVPLAPPVEPRVQMRGSAASASGLVRVGAPTRRARTRSRGRSGGAAAAVGQEPRVVSPSERQPLPKRLPRGTDQSQVKMETGEEEVRDVPDAVMEEAQAV